MLKASRRLFPSWVKVAVAIALGLGTMVGWKRIVVTVGEKIGKTHLTYGQGAAAEIVAFGTIEAADMLGLPVSTTPHLIVRYRRHDGRTRRGRPGSDGSQHYPCSVLDTSGVCTPGRGPIWCRIIFRVPRPGVH